MFEYILRRLILMIPTMLGITLICFVIINLAPGSPVEQKLQAMRFAGAGSAGGAGGSSATGGSAGMDQGVSDEVIEALKKQYGFDKPLMTRYFIWLKNIATLNFGDSFTYEEPVTDVIIGKFPISLQFGVTSFALIYLICIPLGLLMAWKEGQAFDVLSSFLLTVAYSIPGFMLAILLIVFFAGGQYFDWFPIGNAYSDNYDYMGFWEKVGDRIHHFILPLLSYMIGSFTTLSFLMRNSLLDEIKKDYIRTARAKGVTEKVVYLTHALRNALIPIAVGIGGFLGIFLTGSLLIEQIFQLDGVGLLFYNSLLSRDYNVIMAILFLSSLTLVVGKLISDVMLVLVDPRIDFK